MLLDEDDIAEITGIFSQHFESFSTGVNIVVFKEPQKIFIGQNDNMYPGYETHSQSQNYSTVQVSGVFPAIVRYPPKADETLMTDVPLRIKEGQVSIKVEENCSNYISNGKTENILINGMYYNNIGDRTVQNYFGIIHYYYTLSRTT